MPAAFRPDLPMSAVAGIAEKAAAAAWPDVLPLAGGEPRFDPPAEALAALRDADVWQLTKYSPFKGYPELLAGIQRKLAAVNGLEVGLDELITVPGGAAALFTVLGTLVHGERRKVVLTDPCWEHYPNIVTAVGGRSELVGTVPEGPHNRIDLDALARAVDGTTAAVLLNSPLNPTGSMLSAEEIEAVGAICARHGARLVVDEEYETFVYGDRRHVTARAVRPDAISLFSFSKSYALTGLRLGYVTAEPELVEAFKRFGLYSYMYPASPSQLMAAALVNADLTEYTERVRAEYEAKARRFSAALDALPGVECDMPEAGVYVFPRIALPDGSSAGQELIDHQHLLCVPGDVAGATGRGHVRFFLGVDDAVIDEAVARVAAWTKGERR
ncbi:pyridoxal phosphate-dependent aminotransferase [Kitasatospora sp. NPDC093806]|uniref:pyridoxal phosphate-dependent aminotransferase n=1 Tax=Kitasatospora sp. NPDC093806 TaxID=3155075 RepID=UPI00341A0E03